MFRSIALFTSFLAPVAAAAQPADAGASTLRYDNQRFTYSTHLDAADQIIIEGRNDTLREPIRLVVQPTGRVTGRVGVSLVEFTVSQARRDRIAAGLRARQAASVAAAANAIAPSAK